MKMTTLHRHFTRAELAEAAQQLLAARRAGDPEAVKRNLFSPERAAQRERIAATIADLMQAVADRRDPGDAEARWIDSNGSEGATWSEIRDDLAIAFDAARAAALQPGAPAALEHRALLIGALASWMQPACPGGTTPLILLCASIERQARATARAAAQLRATAPLPPRPLHRTPQQAALV